MTHVGVIGAGITGVTTAYALNERGYDVTLFDQHRYAGMETSFANGGQLSASNAEVWNKPATIIQGLRWMTRRDAPLLMNPMPSWHKYSWMTEFLLAMRDYRKNTIETVRLAIESRRYMFAIAEQENIVRYEAPDGLRVEAISVVDVPESWRLQESWTQQRGDQWHAALCAPLLRVPSAIVPLDGSPDMNVLINHQHPAAAEVTTIAAEDFVLDARLF